MSHKFSEYPTYSRDQLLTRLCDLASELTGLYVELSITKASETNARVTQWLQSQETSISGRIEDARYASATETIAVIELESHIRALTEEKFLVLRLLDFV